MLTLLGARWATTTKRDAGVRRQGAEQPLERLDAAGRRADADDEQLAFRLRQVGFP